MTPRIRWSVDDEVAGGGAGVVLPGTVCGLTGNVQSKKSPVNTLGFQWLDSTRCYDDSRVLAGYKPHRNCILKGSDESSLP